MPPPSKFRSGHLPSNAIPVSRTLHGHADESGSNSENDMSTDSEEEVYGGRYSLDSSPQDDRIPNGTTANRHGSLAQRRSQYASDSMYSDVSSSMETVAGRQGHVAERLVKGNGRYPVGQYGYTEDESSDSAASSEFSTTQVGSINGAMPRAKAYVSEGYASSVPSRVNMESAAEKVCDASLSLLFIFVVCWIIHDFVDVVCLDLKNSIPIVFFACSAFAFFLLIESYLLSLLNWSISQDLHSRKLQNENFSDEDDDVPSAPPICGSVHEIKQSSERSHASKVSGSCEVSTKKDRNTLETTSSVKPENDIGNRNPDQFVRFVSLFDGCFLAKAITKHVF